MTSDDTGRTGLSAAPSGKQYFLLNVILAGVIVLIIGYSFFYSPDEERYPVPCIHEKLTGEPCPSCGLSHAFSLIVRGRISEAMEWNSHSMRLFIFFAIQLVMRAGLAVTALREVRNLRVIAVTDAAVSAVMTLTAFYPFLRMLWLTLF
ncbi:MAG: DUF2752 domain-containing protein [Bacteroidales bacterium]|nr:DUF2752 domain-containing protein [Bacteroidales bacterium]